ncbi:MAG: hypothetical protein AAFN27_00945 [Pseudomonadota bacterium]
MREIAQLPRAGSPEKLIINLWRNPDGTLFTRSVEIVDQVTRVRFSFNSDFTIDGIFKNGAVRALKDIVQDSSNRRGMLILPDLKIQLEGILLSGCRVLITATEQGIENIMIRFAKYYGRVNALFNEGFSHRDSLAEDAVDQAVEALEKVYLPLRNFSYYLSDFLNRFPNVLGKQRTEFLRKISNEITTLGYFTDLISHYVSSQEIIARTRGSEARQTVDHSVDHLVPEHVLAKRAEHRDYRYSEQSALENDDSDVARSA